jgi:hypothetical protein
MIFEFTFDSQDLIGGENRPLTPCLFNLNFKEKDTMTGYLNKVECDSQLDIVGFQKKKIIGFWCSWVVAIWLLSHCCCLGSLVLLLSLLALLFGPFVLLLVGSFYIVVVVVGQLFLYCCCLGPFAFWPDFSC